MRISPGLLVAILLAGAAPSHAADICEAVALHDVHDLDSPEAILKKGQRLQAVSQYRINKKTGGDSFCAHGGGCYPAHVMENGQKIEALQLTNCKVGAKDSFDDPDETFYNVVVIRSKIPAARLKVDDMDNKLLDLGLCSACAANAAYLTVNKPSSRCAKLTQQALAGNSNALATLKTNFPDYCQTP